REHPAQLWPSCSAVAVRVLHEPSLNAAPRPGRLCSVAAACNSLTFLLLNLGNFLTYQIFVSLGLLTAVLGWTLWCKLPG
uniref:AGRE1 protein n=1 Tax=Macrostomum lignano TaxID=282301 RepID=A0A1I8FU92_9PLAT